MAEQDRIAVLGLGRLGTCLSHALLQARLPLTAIASARNETAMHVATQLGPNVLAVSPDLLGQHADVIFVTVPDAQVPDISATLNVDAQHALIHASGALDLDALRDASARGVRVGVFHPLQAFPKAASAELFRGIYVGIEAGDPQLDLRLQEIARRLGANPFSLRGADRAGYHAAAVFASNYVVALHAAAERAWVRAGLDGSAARAALTPLTRGAIAAVAQHELADALTGPLARGDRSTLERHLAALAPERDLLELYRVLALELLRLPLALDAATRAALSRLLGQETTPPVV